MTLAPVVPPHLTPPLAPDPTITVLICTCNRGESIVSTVQSIFSNTYTTFTLVIIDQSDDERTARALARFRDDPRLRYVHTTTRGLGMARNIGLALSQDELILITDDDCEVPENWVAEMVAPFHAHPRVGLVFCDVVAAPHDSQAGLVPVSISQRPMLVPDLNHWQTCDGVNIGIGAGMALRHADAVEIGGFNPLFGSGSHFRSGDDLEFTMRMLTARRAVYRTTTVGVVHRGFRSFAQFRKLIRNNMFGVGGVCGQLLRRGQWHGLRYYLAVFIWMVILPALRDLPRLRVPPVLGRAVWLARGLIAGLSISPIQVGGSLFALPQRPADLPEAGAPSPLRVV
jgi:glycosyltransferase involved in cell wall biosynthesis